MRLYDGRFDDLRYHTERFNRSRRALFGCADEIDLAARIAVPDDCRTGLYKCRVVYERDIIGTEFVPYRMRTIRRLQLVCDDTVDYTYKYDDKRALEALAARRGGCDDVIIVKHGCVTDASFCNLAFYDGGRWVTPDTPLLAGTRRARLLEAGRIVEGRIRPGDLGAYSTVAMINAMIDLGQLTIPIDGIVE